MNGTTINILNTLPPYKGDTRLVKRRQGTYDIISEMLKMHEHQAPHYNKFAKTFWKGSVKATAEYLFSYLQKEVVYGIEPGNFQSVKEPQAILKEGRKYGGDCKHYASFIVGVCEALRRMGYPISGYYRFASYSPNNRNLKHVFAVVTGPGQPDYWVDPVSINYGTHDRPNYIPNKFDQREPAPVFYVNKIPRPMDDTIGELYTISGITARPIPGGTEYVQMGAGTGAHWLDQYYGPVHTPAVGYSGEDIGRKSKAERKKTHEQHKAERKAGKRGLLNKVKPGKLLKKFGAAAPRNAFMALLKINFGGLAIKFNAAIKKNKQKVYSWWSNFGGQPNKLQTAISQGVGTHNKLHKHKKVAVNGMGVIGGFGTGGDLSSLVMMSGLNADFLVSGIDNDISMSGIDEVYTLSGIDYQMMGFPAANMRVMASVGFAPPAVPALLAAAAPIIIAAKNLLKSFGIKGADNVDKQAADADEDVAQTHNDAGDDNIDQDGNVDHGGGVKTKVTTDANGDQTMEMSVADPMKGGGSSSSKTPGGGGGSSTEDDSDGDGGTDLMGPDKKKGTKDHETKGLAVFMHNAWDWVTEHKTYFLIGGGILATVIIIKLVRDHRKGGGGRAPKRK